MSIRSFLYLDEYKLYSFSSQLFSGLTEHIVKFSNRSQEHEEKHDHLSGKARLVAEIASEQTGTAEKKFLHDHAYNLFERELESRKSILDIGKTAALSNFTSSKFVRISGPAVVIDAPLIKNTADRFNAIADALAYVSNFKDIEKMRTETDSAIDAIKDRNERARAVHKQKQLTPQNISKMAGMRIDEQFLKQLSFLLEYGYGDQLLLQIPVALEAGGELLFSAVLKRDALREEESLIVQKYARLTDRSVTIVGIPTQSGGTTAPQHPQSEPPKNVKAAISGMISHLYNIEEQFTGRLENEVILDPVAVYVDVEVAEAPA